jgi:presequence protease
MDMEIGKSYSGFKLINKEEIKSINNTLFLLKHEKTNAPYIHLKNSDKNNTFAIGFPTTPVDSTGVAHILEHTALCSSKKYPIRDPFFSMIKRSLQTFMNAFTSSDWTMYPFASINKKDYYNLLDVYLQAVFFPKLEEINFAQEGHRLEFSTPNDPSTKLEIKGVVYNEMKGALSSPQRIMDVKKTEQLFPTVTYHHCSGGDPKNIPDLTYEQFVNFHKTHYHPSNSFIYSYGDFDLKEHLDFINESYLSHFEKADPPSSFGEEVRSNSPISKSFDFPASSEDVASGNKSYYTLSWPLEKVTDPVHVLTFTLIEIILLDHAASPMRKALLDSGLGKAVSSSSGFEKSIRDTFFSLGLDEIKKEDSNKIEKVILDTLEEVVSNSINQQDIDSAIHQIELSNLEVTGGGWPHGLNLLFRFYDSWMHGGDAVSSLSFTKTVDALKEKLKKENYLEDHIKTHLINNPNRSTVILNPNSDMQKNEEEELERKLQKVKDSLSNEEKENIVQAAKELAEHQSKEEDLSILPSIHKSDLTEQTTIFSPGPKIEDKETYQQYLYESATNGLAYLDLYFPIHHLTSEEKKLLPLLGDIITQVATKNSSVEEVQRKISLYTGGIGAGPSCLNSIENDSLDLEFFQVSSKGLVGNFEKMCEIIHEVVSMFVFEDKKHIKTLVSSMANRNKSRILSSGHQLAIALSSRHFNKYSLQSSQYGGLLSANRIITLSQSESLEKEINMMTSIAQKIFTSTNLKVLAIAEAEHSKTIDSSIERLMSQFTLKKYDPVSDLSFEEKTVREIFTTTTPVSYVASSIKVPGPTHPDTAKLNLAAQIISAEYLHTEIREKGGAYGGFVRLRPISNSLSFGSYRDPNIANTLKVYNNSLNWLQKAKIDQETLDSSIISAFGSLDNPGSPAGEAKEDFSYRLRGLSPELRQKYRDSTRESKVSDIIEVGEKYLGGKPSISIITSEEIADKEGVSCTEYDFTKIP